MIGDEWLRLGKTSLLSCSLRCDAGDLELVLNPQHAGASQKVELREQFQLLPSRRQYQHLMVQQSLL
jgi:hypothetical protein